MNDLMSRRVRTAVSRLPDWLRRDLSNKDDLTRQRAEEALAAIMVNSVTEAALD